jgi:hypothetical protein
VDCNGVQKREQHFMGEIGGSIYGTINPTISGSNDCAEINIILPEGLSITAEGLLHTFFFVDPSENHFWPESGRRRSIALTK